MNRVLWGVLIGVAAGSAPGYFGQCSSGTCPLTSTWWRGAIYGYQDGGRTLIGMLRPTVVLAPLSTSGDLKTVAAQVEKNTIAIIEAAR